jgi:hypothetical protein
MPCLPWSRWDGLDLRTGIEGFGEEHELRRLPSGRKNVNTAQESVMPAFGDNPNVACYMDDLYIYLRARANDAVGRVRPPKREDKPDAYTQAETACMGTK